MNQVRELDRSYTVELPILSNTNNKFSFGDNETALDNVLVTGISMLPANLLYAPSGRALMPNNEIVKGYITLCDPGREEFNKSLPLEIFLREEPVLHIAPKIISIRNSYVEFPQINGLAIPGGNNPGYSVLFVFFYKKV